MQQKELIIPLYFEYLLSSGQQQLSVALQGLRRALRAEAARVSGEQVVPFARWCFSSCALAEVDERVSIRLPASVQMRALHQQLRDIRADDLLKQWENLMMSHDRKKT